MVASKDSPGWQWARDLRLPSPEEARHREVHYRRGYYDGWLAGIEAMHDLMNVRGLTFQQAYEAALAFQERELLDWRNTESSLLVRPPLFSLAWADRSAAEADEDA